MFRIVKNYCVSQVLGQLIHWLWDKRSATYRFIFFFDMVLLRCWFCFCCAACCFCCNSLFIHLFLLGFTSLKNCQCYSRPLIISTHHTLNNLQIDRAYCCVAVEFLCVISVLNDNTPLKEHLYRFYHYIFFAVFIKRNHSYCTRCEVKKKDKPTAIVKNNSHFQWQKADNNRREQKKMLED